MENIDFEKWRKMAGIGIVCFAYRKVDGTCRKAVGTRNITVAHHYGFNEFEKGKGKSHNPQAYFDFERRAWRSYSPTLNGSLELLDGADAAELLQKVGIN